MGILEKIADIEAEISKTQKNKATEHHLGLLKAKLAKYRVMLLEPDGKSAAKGQGFDVVKSGDARVVLIGFPSVGKSTLLSKLTGAHSEVAAYEFTTLTAVPGKFVHNGATIQLLDLPGIIEGASKGLGRGRQVIAVAKTADLVLFVLDVNKDNRQRRLLEKELEAIGIRINRKPPNIAFKVQKAGGIKFTATCKVTQLNEKVCYSILHDYKIHHADILVREDCSIDDFIDVVLGNRKYLNALFVYNKIDQITVEELDRISREPYTCVISCELDLNMDYLVDRIWKHLHLTRVYTKKKGEYPDFEGGGVVLRDQATVEDFCDSIHKSFKDSFKYALVWGKSSKHQPQRTGIGHRLMDEDVVQIVRGV